MSGVKKSTSLSRRLRFSGTIMPFTPNDKVTVRMTEEHQPKKRKLHAQGMNFN